MCRTSRRCYAALVAAVCAGLAGCSSHGATAAPPAAAAAVASAVAPAVAPVSPDPATASDLAKFYGQHPAWSTCDGMFQCASVTVPVDWSAPTGETLQLALERLPATDPTHRLGSLFINPGGPGGSGNQLVRAARDIFSAKLREDYDIVGFDPRGVGSSNPVHCLPGPQLDAFLSTNGTPQDAAQIATLQAADAGFAAGCKSESSTLLSHVGTRDVARDVDVLRAVVGDAKLNWFGFSYGTYIGSFYAGMFPQRVGRMVLDGPLDPALDQGSLSEEQAAGFQDEFNRYADHCLAGGHCPIGSSRQQITDAVTGLFAKLANEPMDTADQRVLTQSDAISGVAFAMYDPTQYWDSLTTALHQALNGDGQRLLGMADQILDRTGPGQFADNANEANLAVNCLDHPGEDTVADAKAALPAMKAASVVFGASFAWGNLTCADMPQLNPPPQPGPVPATGAGPILVVGATHDPATPYPWALALSHQLATGVLLTRDGDGHTSYGHGNDCIDTAVDSYLIDGATPRAGTTC
ncbi:MAG TPA: alpha/beta hydrolase [Sporichthyaceae bacterium]|nr:alpha/beta hydrolase [Sporichthyaceae bacterium]